MPKLPKKEIIVFVGGDFHCSHRVGLTPPAWQWKTGEHRGSQLESVHQHQKYGKIQAECWKTFRRLVRSVGPFDVAFLMGDLIDGSGTRSGGTELITTDRDVQRDMAICCVQEIDARVIIGVRGTSYHTGETEDWEDQLYAHFDAQTGYHAKVGDHEWPRIHGVTFDLKHHIGSSGIPHGQWTALGKEWLWNQLWADAGYAPQADLIFRGHVHTAIGGWRYVGNRRVEVATTPALQAMGSKFGARRCSRLVDWGFYVLRITPKGNVCLEPHVIQINTQKAAPTDL